MDWLSTDPERPGVLAIGQEARGIVAFGQLATGVIAVGQIARGVIAVGQLAVGIVALGQVSLGPLWAAGMIGAGGRGFGIVLKVLPKVVVERFLRPILPPLTTLAELRAGARAGGFLLAEIDGGVLAVDGALLELEPSDELARGLREAIAAGHTHACVTVAVEERTRAPEGGYREAAPRDRVLVASRLQSWREAPPRVRLEGKLTSPAGLVLRAVGLLALAAAWWLAAGADVLALFD